jgi:predicted acyl esterase
MRAGIVSVFCVVLGGSRAVAEPPVDPSHTLPVQIGWDQKIVMRDGVKLSATIYRDPKQTKPVPAIVTMTPYIAAHAARQGVYFAQHGYVFVAIDSRGRGNSDGVFVPGRVEGKDGYDAVEWAARQPWCTARSRPGAVRGWGSPSGASPRSFRRT